MLNITATELKNRLGQYLDASLTEPVMIEKSGRASHVVLSRKRYDALLALEDKSWDLRAQSAEQEGFLSEEASEALLTQGLI